MPQFATIYEAVQNYNRLTNFLHMARYRKLIQVLGRLKRDVGDRRIRILDIGCGPGSAVGHIVNRFDIEYLGIDYDPIFIQAAQEKYGAFDNCRFIVGDATDVEHYRANEADIVIALETLEHLPLNRAAQVVEHVCAIVKPRLFLVTVPVEVGPAVWIKNWGSAMMGYDRQSGGFRETFWAGLYQLDRVPAHHTSHQGFDWHCLAQLIRVNAPIRQTGGLPFSFLPRSFSPNVYFLAEPAKSTVNANIADEDAWRINHQPLPSFRNSSC